MSSVSGSQCALCKQDAGLITKLFTQHPHLIQVEELELPDRVKNSIENTHRSEKLVHINVPLTHCVSVKTWTLLFSVCSLCKRWVSSMRLPIDCNENLILKKHPVLFFCHEVI